MISRRTAVKRLADLLLEQRLMFVRVGAHRADDRVVSTVRERDGATVCDPEYRSLLHKIVDATRG